MEHLNAPHRRASATRTGPGIVALTIALGSAATIGVVWPNVADELRASGIVRPDRIVHVVGSVVLSAAAFTMGVAALRARGRRRFGLASVSAGAAILAIATVLMTFRAGHTVGLITAGGPTAPQTFAVVLLVVGVVAMPSEITWNTIAVVDVALATMTAAAFLWLAPVRTSSGPGGGVVDVVTRQPVAVGLVALMVVGVVFLVRCVQAPQPGDLALVVAVLLIPSGLYVSIVGQFAGHASAAARTSTLWWMTGPMILLVAALGSARSADRVPAGAGGVSDAGRSRRSERVATAATLLTLGAVATHRIFIDSLDPVMLGLGLVTVLASTTRLAMLQREQLGLQRHLGLLAEQLHDRARTDELTGLGNRLALTELLQRLLTVDDGGSDDERTIDVFYADVDDFKSVNDALGHETGDRVLVSTAERLVEVLGANVHRVGGDEFVAVRQDLSIAAADELARRVIDCGTEPLDVDGVVVPARLSLGTARMDVAGSRDPAPHDDELIRMADLALNRAKELGRGRSVAYDEHLRERADRRLLVQNGISRAIDGEGFEVTFRPVVDLSSGTALAAEALVRWRAGDGTLVDPAEYFETATDSGRVPAISRSTLLLASTPWRAGTGTDLGLSLNVTIQQLIHLGFVEQLDEVLDGVSRDLVRVQVTESALMDPRTSETIDRLTRNEVRICVRDFGTAASSVRRLDRLHEPTIRVDESFVTGLDDHVTDRLVLEAVVELGAQLDVPVMADGVRTPEQVGRLREIGVDVAQGWLFGPPRTWDGFIAHHDPTRDPTSALEWRPPTDRNAGMQRAWDRPC